MLKKNLIAGIAAVAMAMAAGEAIGVHIDVCDNNMSGCSTGSSGQCPSGACVAYANYGGWKYFCVYCSGEGGHGFGSGISSSSCTGYNTNCSSACSSQGAAWHYASTPIWDLQQNCLKRCAEDDGTAIRCSSTCDYTENNKNYTGTGVLNGDTCQCECKNATFAGCKAGYYLKDVECVVCPSNTCSFGGAVTSPNNNTSITGCCFDAGTSSDTKGSFTWEKTCAS
jgi:hypothetical protein